MSDAIKDPPCEGKEKERANRMIDHVTAGNDLTPGQIRAWVKEFHFLRSPCKKYVFEVIGSDKDFPRDTLAELKKLISDNFRYWRERRRSR